MCKAVLCMWWQLAVLPIKTTVITCMLHKQTTIVSLYMYNKCCSAWQQLRDVKKHTFWCSYVLDSLQNIVCECAQIQNTCMKEESAKNFGATNSAFHTWSRHDDCLFTFKVGKRDRLAFEGLLILRWWASDTWGPKPVYEVLFCWLVS